MSTQSPPEKLHKPNESHTAWLLRRVWDRVNKNNEHFMACIVGREGSGKSHTALRIASELDPTFDADRVIFDVADLLKVLESGEHEPGNFYVLDEAGVQLGRRTWQDRSQILANQAMQLIRNHNLGLIFTLPRLSELDSQAEGRLQAVLEIVEKRPDEYVRLKWKWLDPDRVDSNGNILKKYPRRREDGYKKRITRNTFAPPSGGYVEEYEEEKSDFQSEVYQKTIAQLEGNEESEEAEELSVKDVANRIMDGGLEAVVSQHSQTKQPYINKDLIRAEYDVSHSDARAVKSVLEKEMDGEQIE